MPNKWWLYPSLLRRKLRAGNVRHASTAGEVHKEYVQMAKTDNVNWGEKRDLGLNFWRIPTFNDQMAKNKLTK